MDGTRCRSAVTGGTGGRRRSRSPRRQFLRLPQFLAQSSQSGWIDTCFNYLLLAGVIAAIYFILEFHCTHCGTRYDLNNVTMALEYISNNLTLMKLSYQDLENQVIRVSRELPKMEGQIEVLETLASTMENGDYIWDPNQKAGLPYIEIIKQQQQYNNKNKNNYKHAHDKKGRPIYT